MGITHLSINRGMVKGWHIHPTEYDWVLLKRNEQSIRETPWVNLQKILLCEKSQPTKVTYCMSLFLKWQNGNGKELHGRLGLKRGGGGRRKVSYSGGDVRDPRSDGNALRSPPGSVPWLWRRFHWGKRVWPLSLLFHNHMQIYNYLKAIICKEKSLPTSHQKQWAVTLQL